MANLSTILRGILFPVLLQESFCKTPTEAFTPRISLSQSVPLCRMPLIRTEKLPDDYSQCEMAIAESRGKYHPDQDKTTDEIIASYGYFLEVHNVTTHDGYMLTIHRITGGAISPPEEGKPSVFLSHGMAGSSEGWFIQHGARNLAFKLADAGYDLWLGNARGSTYSLGHAHFNAATDMEYWDFSWHEMGIGDNPAIIDKIISVTGNSKVSYIGYSMGTSSYFAGLSTLPELNEKIEVGILMAPVAFQGHSNGPVRLLAPLSVADVQKWASPLLMGRFDDFKNFQKLTNISLGDMCVTTATRCGICDNFLYFTSGFDAPQQNYTNLPNILSKFPNNVSFKTLVHYSQSMNTCQFRQYDYGRIKNMLRYGSLAPPKYDLKQITAPTYLLHGDADNMAVPADVFITRDNMLPTTVKEVYRVDWPLFNHLDFQFAKDADILVYDKVLSILQSTYYDL